MHVTIIGAGLGGLATAALLRQGGAEVTLVDRAEPGGRARTSTHAGALVNLGPHALYRGSRAIPVLHRLGATPIGGLVPAAGRVLRAGALHELPGAAASLWSTSVLSPTEKLRLGAWFAMPPPPGTVQKWLAPASPALRDLLSGLVRLSTYAHAPEQMSAQAAFAQLRRALAGVLYLDGGWQSLVDALLPLAGPVTRADVRSLPTGGPLVLAGPPSLARSLGIELPDLVEARVSCLDLVLDGLPVPENRFVLGLDEALYLSEHGHLAALGGTVLHAAQYLAPGETGDRATLERLLDRAQPGWRDHVRWSRFAPSLVASHRVDRPGEQVPMGPRPGVFLVGDYVGEAAMLADRVFDSAERVANALLARVRMAA